MLGTKLQNNVLLWDLPLLKLLHMVFHESPFKFGSSQLCAASNLCHCDKLDHVPIKSEANWIQQTDERG